MKNREMKPFETEYLEGEAFFETVIVTFFPMSDKARISKGATRSLVFGYVDLFGEEPFEILEEFDVMAVQSSSIIQFTKEIVYTKDFKYCRLLTTSSSGINSIASERAEFTYHESKSLKSTPLRLITEEVERITQSKKWANLVY